MVHVFTIMSSPLSLAFLIYASMLWSPCSPYYRSDTQGRMRAKLRNMARELLRDAEMKIKSVQQYRNQYYKTVQFQMGLFTYDMRDQYKQMVRKFQLVHRNVSYGHYDKFLNVQTMIYVHWASLEIEQKVMMIQRWPGAQEFSGFHDRMRSVRRSGINHEYDELEDVPLREVQVRERLARRAAVVGAPPPLRALRRRARTHSPSLVLGDQRKNKKWRPSRDVDFARRSL